MLATVVVPTHDHGEMLALSVGSALAQTVTDLEVLIVGDGPTDETRACAERLEAADPRVRWLANPKGPRHGEVHRHTALQGARGRYVMYLSDDDLWFPEHVERMAGVFEETGADFVHAVTLWTKPGGELLRWTIDLSLPQHRRLTLGGESRIGLSAGAHTLDAYRRLATGWAETPHGSYVDHTMWLRFLQAPDMTFAALHVPTVLILAGSLRRDMSYGERVAEQRSLLPLLSDERLRREFLERLAGDQGRRFAWLDANHAETLEFIERNAAETDAWIAQRNAEIERLSAEASGLWQRLHAAERPRDDAGKRSRIQSASSGVRRWLRPRSPR